VRSGPMGKKGSTVQRRCSVQELIVIFAVPACVAMTALTFVGVLSLTGQPVAVEGERHQ
jgi:hypothetical protein